MVEKSDCENLEYLFSLGIKLVRCYGNHPKYKNYIITENDRKKAFDLKWQEITVTLADAINWLDGGGWLGYLPYSLGLSIADLDGKDLPIKNQEYFDKAKQEIYDAVGRNNCIGALKSNSPFSEHLIFAYKHGTPVGNKDWKYGQIRCKKGYVVLYNIKGFTNLVKELEAHPVNYTPLDLHKLLPQKVRSRVAATAEAFSVSHPDTEQQTTTLFEQYISEKKMLVKLAAEHDSWVSDLGLLRKSGYYSEKEALELCDNRTENLKRVNNMWKNWSPEATKCASILKPLFQRSGIELFTEYTKRYNKTTYTLPKTSQKEKAKYQLLEIRTDTPYRTREEICGILLEFPFLFEGAVTILFGRAKDGKSTLMRIVATKLMKKGWAIYSVSEESWDDRVKKHQGVGVENGKLFTSNIMPPADVMIEQLKGVLAKNSKTVLVVDTVSKLAPKWGFPNIYSNVEMGPFLDKFSGIARTFHIPILLLHHKSQHKKSADGSKVQEKGLGASALEQSPENILYFNRHKQIIDITATGRDVGEQRWACKVTDPLDENKTMWGNYVETEPLEDIDEEDGNVNTELLIQIVDFISGQGNTATSGTIAKKIKVRKQIRLDALSELCELRILNKQNRNAPYDIIMPYEDAIETITTR